MEEPILSQPDPQPERNDTVTFKRSHFYSVLVVLAFAAGLLVGYLAWGRAGSSQMAANTPNNAGQVVQDNLPTAAPKFVRYNIPTDGFPSLGPQDAPITIVEFSDYQCPYCRKWYQEVYQPLLAAYPGEIRMVYRNLPLTTIHPDAFSAAEAALCAGEQNAYWPYHDMLFDQAYGLGQDAYLKYAADLGLDTTTFESCLTEERFKQTINDDMNFSIGMGVNSTPTFFINGLALVGAQPIEVFKQVIDKELAGEIPQN